MSTLCPHDRRVNGWQQRTAPPSPITLKAATVPNWRALLAELRATEANMLDPAVDARRDQLIALIQSQGPEWAEAECLADLMALSARIAARGRAKLAAIIIPNLTDTMYTAAVATGDDVQRIGTRFPSYEAAEYAANYLIKIKRRNAGLDRLLDKVAPPADPVEQRAREDAEGERMGGERWE